MWQGDVRNALENSGLVAIFTNYNRVDGDPFSASLLDGPNVSLSKG